MTTLTCTASDLITLAAIIANPANWAPATKWRTPASELHLIVDGGPVVLTQHLRADGSLSCWDVLDTDFRRPLMGQLRGLMHDAFGSQDYFEDGDEPDYDTVQPDSVEAYDRWLAQQPDTSHRWRDYPIDDPSLPF